MHFDPNQLALHIISVSDFPAIDSVQELLQVGTLQDIGTGLDWGRDAAAVSALQTKQTAVVLEPLTSQVLYVVRPEEITLH